MFFQLFDSFFYISLAITFGLILLMVYHFKNRIQSLEEKNQDLSELCQMMIKELQDVKYIHEKLHSSSSSSSHLLHSSQPKPQPHRERRHRHRSHRRRKRRCHVIFHAIHRPIALPSASTPASTFPDVHDSCGCCAMRSTIIRRRRRRR